MVFKRRDRRSIWKIVSEFIYPKGGWARAFEYVKHRVRRLPDTPEKIARGVMAGVATTFTPFFGLHFVVAAVLAKLMRGNMLAALMATFFGNPLTYLPIAWTSLTTGHWLLGTNLDREMLREGGRGACNLGCQFSTALNDLWHNFLALFTADKMDWTGLSIFYDETFYPFMVGSLIAGAIAGVIAYYVTLPLVAAYQNRRRKVLREKLKKLGKPDLSD